MSCQKKTMKDQFRFGLETAPLLLLFEREPPDELLLFTEDPDEEDDEGL